MIVFFSNRKFNKFFDIMSRMDDASSLVANIIFILFFYLLVIKL